MKTQNDRLPEQEPSIIRVLLADDHRLVREGIRSLLEAMPGVVVLGEASDGQQALELARTSLPDVVLMDIAMKGMNGLEATARMRETSPASRVIILSMHDSSDYVLQALRAGACGYILKDAATIELGQAIETVLRGGTYLSPAVQAKIDESHLQGGKLLLSDLLTPRQTEILRLIAAGNNTKEIAFQLKISIKTVETHRAQIMERLGIRDIAGLVRYAIRNGLIQVDE